MLKLEEKSQELDVRSQAYRAVSFFHEMNPLNQAKSNDSSSTVDQFQKHAGNSSCFQVEKTKQ
jgi:hypothetical protein